MRLNAVEIHYWPVAVHNIITKPVLGFLMRVSHFFVYVNAHLLLNAIYIQGLTSNHCKDSRLLLVEGK